jgi:hypothetical protein
LTQRSIAQLAQRQAELVAELSEVRAEIAARAGQSDPVKPKRTTQKESTR